MPEPKVVDDLSQSKKAVKPYYKLTVKIPLSSRRYLYILKKRFNYKSLDRLVADMIDEKTQQMFSTAHEGKGFESY